MSLYSVNQATLIGNITKDPEVRFTKNNNPVCSFSIATNESVKRGDEWEEVPTYHNIVSWGKQAEYVGNNLQKGDKIYIEGRIQNRSWDKEDGSKGYITEIVSSKIIAFQNNNLKKQVSTALGVGNKENIELADDVPF